MQRSSILVEEGARVQWQPDSRHLSLLPYFSDCRLRTDLDLIDTIKGLLTEVAEEGHLTESVLKHNTCFVLGILSLGG